jgi:8-oxo-dGTP pyrophosphatase MutT (NUDIX family)
VLRKNGWVLIARRPIATLLPGLWEFPGGEPRPGESLLGALRRHLAERLGILLKNPKPYAAHTQLLSHRELEIRAFSCAWTRGAPRPRWYTERKWVPLNHLGKVPFTAGMAELARRL